VYVHAVPEFPDYDPAAAEAAQRRGHGGLGAFLGIVVVDVGPGTMRCRVEVRDELKNAFGMLHGGVVSAVVDHMLGAVCYPVIAPGAWSATTEFKLNFLAPVREGAIEAAAEIVSMSKRTAVVRIDVGNGDRLVAVAQGTVTIKAPRA
jgi:1,4-dihydroxy-2-naphthoyl-CoA hydrolase